SGRGRGPEAGPANDAGRQDGQLGPGQVADDGPADGLLPPGLGLAVIHDQVGLAKVARRAEVQYATGCAPVERDGRVAEWAEGDRDRHTPDSVIDYLVPDRDQHWISTALGPNRQRHQGLGWFERGAGFGGAQKLGVVGRWDAAVAWPATADFAQGHAVFVEIGLPAVPTESLHLWR